MANLKSLKTRISSIQSTSKITQAMKVVSAAKLQKAKDAIESNRPYTEEMNKLMPALTSQVLYKEQHPIICGRAKKSLNYLIVAIGSERGLCGSFNSSLAKRINKAVVELQRKGHSIMIECIGNKIYSLLQYSSSVQVDIIEKSNTLGSEEVRNFSQSIIDRFNSKDMDVCIGFYNKFINAVARDIETKQLVPLTSDADAVTTLELTFGIPKEELGNKKSNPSIQGANSSSISQEEEQFECEPDAESIIKGLLEGFITGNTISMLRESNASEYGARMTSMDNATRNAKDMVDSLTTLYNRTRQSVVTTELIEIISGAESIKN